ncbi:hypothetical protein CTI12_AA051640 [Artemisia annua]|uniref:Uncharacterized protein n=1 Tax=Artemisia annua TaxID=35608 RepID=A0A2U1QB90_ARTAN|nr:hypothetical protein CTI12_AA051640 [Artemisia annua]
MKNTLPPESLYQKVKARLFLGLKIFERSKVTKKTSDLQGCCPLMRVAAINATVDWSCQDQRRVLPELATLIYADPDPLVRSAAINATGQLSTALEPDLQLLYIPALAEAIYKDPDPRVKFGAINATIQLSTNLVPKSQFQYPSLVLPALTKAIYDFENPEFQTHAASAVVNISKNYPPDTSTPYLVEILGTLLETHASSRLEIPELQHRKVITGEDIVWHQTRISASEILLIQFKMQLPPDTWDSIRSSLRPNQQAEFLDIWDVALQVLKDHPELISNRGSMLKVLAQKPQAFKPKPPSCINSVPRCVPQVLRPLEYWDGCPAWKLLSIIFISIAELPWTEIYDIMRGPANPNTPIGEKRKYPWRVLFLAAEVGNSVFIYEVIRLYPELLLEVNDTNQSIFHVAVSCRREDIFSLLYEVGSTKDRILTLEDKNGNNMLHLAGILTERVEQNRSDYIPGAAQKLQRELLLYKVGTMATIES